MTFFSGSQCLPSFTNSTLVLPTLSVGKVGGLAMDLLVGTYGLPRVGWLEDENVLPVAGNDALAQLPPSDGGGPSSTNLEVFHDAQNRITYIQQRAPAIRNRNAAFVKNLFKWITESGFREVVILASVDSARRITEAQFCDQLGRYVAVGSAAPKSHQFEWPSLEEGSFDSAFKNTSFAAMALEAARKAGLAATILAIFCAEGVNIPHAFALADATFHYLGLTQPSALDAPPLPEEEKSRPPRWRPPISWHHLVQLPSAFDATLFG